MPPLAQLVERRTVNPQVVGSSPTGVTNMVIWCNWTALSLATARIQVRDLLLPPAPLDYLDRSTSSEDVGIGS